MLIYAKHSVGNEIVWRAVVGDALVEIRAAKVNRRGRFQGSAVVIQAEQRSEYVGDLTFPSADIAQAHCSLWVELILDGHWEIVFAETARERITYTNR